MSVTMHFCQTYVIKTSERLSHGFCTYFPVLVFSISETVSLARELYNKSEATKQNCEPAAVYDCRKQGVIATARPPRLLLSQIAAIRLAS